MEAVDDKTSRKLLDRTAVADAVRQLSVVDAPRSVLAIAMQWLVIAFAIAAAIASHRWYIYVAAVFIIGTRQHALGVLTHEAAHYRLFRHRALNDVVSDFLLAFPSGISTNVYRRHHFEHHKYVNTDKDPNIQLVRDDEDWLWPKFPWECAKIFARDLIGMNFLYIASQIWSWSPLPALFGTADQRWRLGPWEHLRLFVFAAGLAAALTLAGGWKFFFLLWIVPACTSLTFINRVRNLAEHYGVENEHELNASRHVSPSWWERLVFAPCNINYHLEHHLFPSVPFHNLPRLHARLMQDEVFRANAHLTQSYSGVVRGVLAELLHRSSRSPNAAACLGR
jgi:fatty acid desaturase